MQKKCLKCQSNFNIEPKDQIFLARYDIPDPSHCPNCRQRRRASFRNSRNLYRRNCNFSGKQIISLYSPDKPFKVYDTEIWWSDKWDALSYGRDFDFSKPFFPQFKSLMKEVPRPALFNKGSENSLYTNHAVYNKNCYMCFNAGYCEDTFYSGDVAVKCKDCSDLTNVIEAELLYECIDCSKCYSSSHLIRCSGCSDSRFLFDCRSCNNCLLCANLRNKFYCIANEQLSKEEYEYQVAQLNFGSRKVQSELFEKFKKMIEETAVHPHIVSQSAENANGDYIFQSKNVFASFDVNDCEDIRYCFDTWDIKDCMDIFQTMDKAEQQYETHASSVSVMAFFCNISHENHDIQYTDHCFNSAYLFGCVGLQRQKFCMLNKQYTEVEYRELLPKIIAQMKQTGEYGEFFPSQLSPFGYNETMAQDYFPISKEEAKLQGFSWNEYENEIDTGVKKIEGNLVADDIKDFDNSAEDIIIGCAQTKTPFRLTKQELALHRKMGLPIPIYHPDIRAKQRSDLRNQRKLNDRLCSQCSCKIKSTISNESKKIVLCEKCYLKVIQ